MSIKCKKFPRPAVLLLAVILLLPLLSGCSLRSQNGLQAESGIISDELILSFHADATQEQIRSYLSRLEAKADDTLSDIGVYRLILPAALPVEELEALAAHLEADNLVQSVHLNTLLDLEKASTTGSCIPNDPWNGNSWDIDVPGGENWGVEAIDAPGAWQYLDRMTTVNVGLIEDSVPNSNHPDLKGTFANRQCLCIGKDGSIEEVDTTSRWSETHSTQVAGIMNAAFSNGKGVSGIMGGKGRMYSYAILDNNDLDDEDYYSGTVNAYSYLVALEALIQQDVRVINISMGGYECCYGASHGNRNALNYINLQADLAVDVLSRIIDERTAAGKPDFVIVVGAGNTNNDTFYKDDDVYLGYRKDRTLRERFSAALDNAATGDAQARYSHFLNAIEDPKIKDRVIVVGAVQIDQSTSTETDTRYVYTDFSTVGDRIDLVAPGKQIYSCAKYGYTTLFGSGTSFSAPHAAGVAGLVFACDPTLSGPQVKEILLSTATGSYAHGLSSDPEGAVSGMVNAEQAVKKALGLLEETAPAPESPAPEPAIIPEPLPAPEPIPAPETVPVETEPTEDAHDREPVGFVVITEAIYPEGSWTGDQKAYFDYLAGKGYIDSISNQWIREACREQVVSNYYTFRDLDFNGTDELILWLGYTGADGEIMVFTIEGGDVHYVGSAPCDGTGTNLFCSDHDNEFILASFDGDEVYGSIWELSGSRLQICSEFYDGDIPFLWNLVDRLGSLPLEARHVEIPVYETSDHGYEEFLKCEAYVYFVENQVLFDDWFSGSTTADCWIYDVDHDGIKELIVRLGNFSGDNELLFFTLSGDDPVHVSTIPCTAGVSLSGNSSIQGVLAVSNDGTLESVSRHTLHRVFLQTEANYIPAESDWYAIAPILP